MKDATVYGLVDSSKTEVEEFMQFADRGAQVLLVTSGIVLHNLAIRCALNKRAQRPLLLWRQVADELSTAFILGEIIEAGASGSDGILFRNDELEDTDTLVENIEKCRSNGLSSLIEVKGDGDLEAINSLSVKPDGIITFNEARLGSEVDSSLVHVHLSSSGVPTLYTEAENIPAKPVEDTTTSPIVKVCGIKTVEAAQVALDAGANMIGMIMVPNRARTVDMETAAQISNLVRSYRRPGSFELDANDLDGSTHSAVAHIIEAKTRTRPAIVGVFRNQPLAEVLRLQQELSLDYVQLHGSEPLEWCRLIPCPVIRRFTPDTPDFNASPVTGYHSLSLIDGEVGGEGKMVDWSGVQSRAHMGARFLMAGGLTADNVTQALEVEGACGVDVSGGVESSPGVKDLSEIERFVKAAKGVTVKF